MSHSNTNTDNIDCEAVAKIQNENAVKIVNGKRTETTPSASELGLALYYVLRNDYLDLKSEGVIKGIERVISESKNAKEAAEVIFGAIQSMDDQDIE